MKKIFLIAAILISVTASSQLTTPSIDSITLPCKEVLYSKLYAAYEPVFGYSDAGCIIRAYKHYGFKFNGKFVTLFRKRIYSDADKKRIIYARRHKYAMRH